MAGQDGAKVLRRGPTADPAAGQLDREFFVVFGGFIYHLKIPGGRGDHTDRSEG